MRDYFSYIVGLQGWGLFVLSNAALAFMAWLGLERNAIAVFQISTIYLMQQKCLMNRTAT
jgi:hypothetical protein